MDYYINERLYIKWLRDIASVNIEDFDKVDRPIAALGGAGEDKDSSQRGRTLPERFHPPVLTQEQADAIHDLKPFLKAVADVNRLAILQELSRSNGLNVLDLADRLLLSQPLTSWHLHILKRARLVTVANVGRQHVYRINRARLDEYKQLFDSMVDL
jgi:DNA-binding transcriptional ArsR family regulator